MQDVVLDWEYAGSGERAEVERDDRVTGPKHACAFQDDTLTQPYGFVKVVQGRTEYTLEHL